MMRKNIKIILVTVFFGVNLSYSQIITPGFVLDGAKNYYEGNQTYSFKVFSKSKSSIAEDSSTFTSINYVDKKRNLAVLQFYNGNVLLSINSSIYTIEAESKLFKEVKINRYKVQIRGRFEDNLMLKTDLFFLALKFQKFSLAQNDSLFILSNDKKVIKFQKSDFKVVEIIETIFDSKHKGWQYSQKIFLEDTTKKEVFDSLLAIVENKNNKTIDTVRVDLRPTNIDISVFKGKKYINSKLGIEKILGKVILIDFFYQSCLPCLLAHPILNELYENRSDRFSIIGVDHNLSDTLNMQLYLDRYQVRYPIFLGEGAKELSNLFDVRAWPTFVLIDERGTVLEYQAGLSNSFFRRIRKRVDSGN